jgi:anti-sigma regulatory factor (Ser/Thr protein kinase)
MRDDGEDWMGGGAMVSTAQDWFAVAGQDLVGSGALFLRRPVAGVVELDVSTEPVAMARRYVVAVLGEWDVPRGVREDMELVCAELVANALEATAALRVLAPAGRWPVGLRLLGDQERIVLEVWDCHPDIPVRSPPDLVASGELECGRGLAIVEGLTSGWGWRRLSARVKAVWAELPLPARSPLSPAGPGQEQAR